MQLYIDPGTGSMLFTILIAVIGSLVFLLRNIWLKLGVLLSGGKKSAADADLQPLVIFAESKRYWSVFEPICNELEKRGQSVVYLTGSPDDPIFGKGYMYIQPQMVGEGNRAFARLNMPKARIVLSTTPGLDVYQWKRSRDVKYYIHIAHAPNDITLYRMFGLDYYDAVILSGSYQVNQIRKLEKLRNLPAKELPVLGIPYMDEAKKRLQRAEPLPESVNKTVLLAPSWGPSAILSKYGYRMIDALLATGYHIIIRPHPQSFTSEKEKMDQLMTAYSNQVQLEWDRSTDNFDTLRRSDILISDFSGIVFDYTLVHDKPVLYADTSFDSAIYDACWLEEPLWTFQVLPQLGMQITEEDLPHLKKMIDICIVDPKFAVAREKIRNETWVHRGESAALIADYLTGKLNEFQQTGTVSAPSPSGGNNK